ncbi:peptidase M50 [Mycolicibacter icosiumassiliensis]|uniref:peptidase M50 n=1 Tax=Mycolicibacter icosiumassiliensis TaxID=1792835 RepID=UPI00082A00D3
MPPETAVLLFAGRPLPGPLRGLPTVRVGEDTSTDDLNALDAAVARYRRLVVVGADVDLARIVTRLLRADRLDVEVAYVPQRRTPATAAYRLPAGWRAARRARRGAAHPVPLVWHSNKENPVASAFAGHIYAMIGLKDAVDDDALFDGNVTAVLIEPMGTAPGVRAGVPDRRGRVRRWVAGRAAQLGTTGALVVRDGIYSSRTVKRSTFYRHIEDWLLVR